MAQGRGIFKRLDLILKDHKSRAKFKCRSAAGESRPCFDVVKASMKKESHMPDWKPEIRRRLQNLSLAPTREAAIVEELAKHIDDRYTESLLRGQTGWEESQQ